MVSNQSDKMQQDQHTQCAIGKSKTPVSCSNKKIMTKTRHLLYKEKLKIMPIKYGTLMTTTETLHKLTLTEFLPDSLATKSPMSAFLINEAISSPCSDTVVKPILNVEVTTASDILHFT